MLEIPDERSIRRIRLLVARASQDCGAMHPQLFELGALLDRVLVRADLTADDVRSIERLSELISDEADDCVRTLHCDFVRRDLVCELRELDDRLRHSFQPPQPRLMMANA